MNDLNSLGMDELKDLRKRLGKAIASFEARKISAARAAVEAAAREHGFALAELVSDAAITRRKPVTPKYANPDDASDTWTGRGRKPIWFANAIAAGKSAEDMLIVTA